MLGPYIVVFILLLHLLMLLVGIALNSSDETKILEVNTHQKVRASLDKIFQEEAFSDLRNIIDELIEYEEKRFVVYIDVENDLDWETTGEMNEVIRSEEAQTILSEIDVVRHQSGVRFYSPDVKKELIWYLGRTLILVLNGQLGIARDMLDKAKRFSYERNSEITRLWQLWFSFLIYGVMLIAFFFVQCCLGESVEMLENILRWFLYGCTGVTLSILHQSGYLHYDCGAGKMLNFAQIASKYMAGGIGACFIVMLFQSGIVFSIFQESSNVESIMMIVGIIGGFSERLVPSLIEQLSKDKTKTKEGMDDAK